MGSIVSLICRLFAWAFPREKSKDVIEGFDRFSERIEGRLDAAWLRIDECDKDREDLRLIALDNTRRIGDCEQRHLDREVRERALMDKLKLLEDNHALLEKFKKYSEDATHRMLGSMAPIQNLLTVLCLNQGIELQDVDMRKIYRNRDGVEVEYPE